MKSTMLSTSSAPSTLHSQTPTRHLLFLNTWRMTIKTCTIRDACIWSANRMLRVGSGKYEGLDSIGFGKRNLFGTGIRGSVLNAALSLEDHSSKTCCR